MPTAALLLDFVEEVTSPGGSAPVRVNTDKTDRVLLAPAVAFKGNAPPIEELIEHPREGDRVYRLGEQMLLVRGSAWAFLSEDERSSKLCYDKLAPLGATMRRSIDLNWCLVGTCVL